MESLKYLCLRGTDIPSTLFTSSGPRRLQTLELYGGIITPEEDVEKLLTLPNLTKLVLSLSGVNNGFIDKIGKLLCLQELVLLSGSCVKETIAFSGAGFDYLIKLVLGNLNQVRELIGSEALPKVERIKVTACTGMSLKLEGQQALGNITDFVVIKMPANWGVEAAHLR